MSWGIEKAGKAAEVKVAFQAEVARILGYNPPEVEKQILAAHLATVEAQCDAAQERTVIAASNGSADSAGNSQSALTVRTLYGS